MRENIDLDLVGIKLNAFLFQVVLNVALTFVSIVNYPVGPSTGFLFHFEEGVDVGREQLVGFAREVPDFVHVLNDVTSIDGFLQFGGWPGTYETALSVSVTAMVTAFGQRFRLFFFHAGSTEGKREFATAAVG